VNQAATNIDQRELLLRLEEYEQKLAQLAAENAHLRGLLFGPKTEKSRQVDDGQLSLFGPSPSEASATEEEPDTVEVKSFRRKKRGGRTEIPDHLPREEVLIEVPQEDRGCELCDAELVPFKDAVSERVKLVPARVVVIRTVRKQYRCPEGHSLVTAPAPPEILPRSKYDTSVAAHLVVAKYADHLPLHRQVEILKRAGINIPKSTVCDLVMRVGELMAPVVKAMEAELKSGGYIQSDDTPITVLEEGKKGSRQGHMWVWRREHLVVFRFNFSRGRDGPLAFLGDWTGHLQTDGLASYNAVVKANDLTHHGCWAHVRRKFFDCLKSGEKRATTMVRLTNELFAIERDAQADGMAPSAVFAARSRLRRERSLPVLEKIDVEAAAIENDPAVSKASALAKAVGYMNHQWSSLTRFVEAPSVMIHNNDAERALRAVAVGRKNYLFAGSPRGAAVAATLYSLLGTCRVLDLPMERYLCEVTNRALAEPEVDPAELTPWAWARAAGLDLPSSFADD